MPRKVSQVAAVKLDLDGIRPRDPNLAAGALATAALKAAEIVDDMRVSPNARVFALRELRETMDRIRELAPPVEKRDVIDDVARKREARRAARRSAAEAGGHPS
jgi:hypothetical protein